MNNKLKIMHGLVMVLVLAQLVSAFGVTTPFYDKNPLITSPGKVEEVVLLLQNTDEKKDVTLKAQIIEGADIAELTDENVEYSVPMGEKNVQVNLRVTVPETMKPGDARQIKVRFNQLDIDQEGKMVQLSTGITAITPLIIASPFVPVSARGSNNVLVAAMVLLALAAVIGVFMFMKKKK